MDEDKQAQPVQEFNQTETTGKKPRFQINFFQTARVHTEQVVQEFEDRTDAERFAKELCDDKNIDHDFEIEELPEPEVEGEAVPSEPENAVEVEGEAADRVEAEAESENSPEGSDEKTTPENSLPVN